MGSVEARQELRKKLHCRPFEWFLDNVAHEGPAPRLVPSNHLGSLVHLSSGGCIDTLGNAVAGARVTAYHCLENENGTRRLPGRGTQAIAMDEAGHIRMGKGELCMANGEEGPVFRPCSD